MFPPRRSVTSHTATGIFLRPPSAAGNFGTVSRCWKCPARHHQSRQFTLEISRYHRRQRTPGMLNIEDAPGRGTPGIAGNIPPGPSASPVTVGPVVSRRPELRSRPTAVHSRLHRSVAPSSCCQSMSWGRFKSASPVSCRLACLLGHFGIFELLRLFC